MENPCTRQKCPMNGLAARFRDHQEIKALVERMPKVTNGVLYSIEAKDTENMEGVYWVVIFCGCIGQKTLYQVEKLVGTGATVLDHGMRNELIGFGLRKFAEAVGFDVAYYTPTETKH